MATVCGHYKIVQMLLNLGASVETRSPKEAFTVLHIAVACNQERIIDLLLVHDANIHARARVKESYSLF